MGFGRYYEDFKIGDIYEHFPAKTITESDNNLFCLLTRNAHPLHSDVVYAERTEFQQRVVVGTLVFSLAVGMSVPDVSGQAIANLGYDEVEHHAPVYIGDTVSAKTEVLGKRICQHRPEGIAFVLTRVMNQSGELVLSFKRSILVPRRPNGSA